MLIYNYKDILMIGIRKTFANSMKIFYLLHQQTVLKEKGDLSILLSYKNVYGSIVKVLIGYRKIY